MIERLLTPGSIFKQTMRRCVVGKDTLSLFPIPGQAVYLLLSISLTEDLQTGPDKRCCALVWLDKRSVLGSYAGVNKLKP